MTDAPAQTLPVASPRPPHGAAIPPHDALVSWLRNRVATHPDAPRHTRSALNFACIRGIGLGVTTPAEIRDAMREAGWRPVPPLGRLVAVWGDANQYVRTQAAFSSPAGRWKFRIALWRRVVGRVFGSAESRTLRALDPAERARVLRAFVLIALRADSLIVKGEWNNGGAVIVTNGWLSEQLGVSHHTARKVLGILSAKGCEVGASVAVSAGSSAHEEVEALRHNDPGSYSTRAGRKAAKLLADGYVLARVKENEGALEYQFQLHCRGLRWLQAVSPDKPGPQEVNPDKPDPRMWKPTELSGTATVAAADARMEVTAALAGGEAFRHPVADALSTAGHRVWGYGTFPDGKKLPESAWITAVLDADGTLPTDVRKRELGVGSSRDVRRVRAWLTDVAGGGLLSWGLLKEDERQEISERVIAARRRSAARVAKDPTKDREAQKERIDRLSAERGLASRTLAQAVVITGKAALRDAGLPASDWRGGRGFLDHDRPRRDAYNWLIDARAGLPEAIRRRAKEAARRQVSVQLVLPTAEALSWVVAREVTKRGGSDDLARAQSDAVVRALNGRWSWALEAQLWVALNVGRVADGATVEDYLAWRDRVVGALRDHDAVRPQLADALGAHVAQRLAAAGAPPQVSERSAAAVREAGLAELMVPVF